MNKPKPTMQLQIPSKHERDQYGEHLVRVITDHRVGAPATNTLERLNEQLPDGLRAKAPDTDGYGTTAYVICDSAEEKREAELALFGEDHVAEVIDGYRKWLAVHSYIYYDLGTNAVPDSSWDRKALELAYVQDVHGHDSGTWKNDAFEGFSGDTGMHLPRTEEVKERAQSLVEDEQGSDC